MRYIAEVVVLFLMLGTGLVCLPGEALLPGDVIASVDYHDQVMTNGGQYTVNKNFDFDSRDKTPGRSNLETEKVLTYQSREGAHLAGEELLVLDTAGDWTTNTSSVRCVFMPAAEIVFPAFCNKVTAKATLLSVNNAKISSKADIRAVGADSFVPAALNYLIAVNPAENGAAANGTVKTFLGVGIAEARDNREQTWNKTAATNVWTDRSAVTGGIRSFEKSLNYESGIRI